MTRTLALVGALFVWVFAQTPPLTTFVRDGFASAHALQHFLVVMIAAPLLVAGLPPVATASVLASGVGRGLGRLLSRPVATWVIGLAAMLCAHLPWLRDAEMMYPGVLIVASLASLIAACMFWWPIFTPVDRRSLEPLGAIPYLATACLACTVVGIVIAFGPAGTSPMAAHLGASSGLVLALYERGFTAAVDQQVSGLIVWVPGCLVYVGAMLLTLGRWYGTAESFGAAT